MGFDFTCQYRFVRTKFLDDKFLLGVIGWLSISKGVTVLQSQYATLSGPVYRDYWNLYYQPPWSRVGPYAVGVLGAIALRAFQRRDRKLKPAFYIIGWIVATTVCLAIMFGNIPMEKNVGKYLNSARDTVYLMFDRIVWSFSILFVIFACQTVS